MSLVFIALVPGTHAGSTLGPRQLEFPTWAHLWRGPALAEQAGDPRSAYKRSLQRRDTVGSGGQGDARGRRHTVEAVVCTRVHVQFGRHSRLRQALGVVDVFVAKEVGRTDINEGRGQSRQV